jgi:hypothetical protein
VVQVSQAALIGNPPMKLWTTKRISRGGIVRHGKFGSGQKQASHSETTMSALPPKADMGTQPRDVRFVPLADIPR